MEVSAKILIVIISNQGPHGSSTHTQLANTPSGIRERNKRAKLDRITRAATELFTDQGFEATTGRQICQRAGIGTGTLFLYVKDKRELLSLIFQPLAEGVFSDLTRGLAKNESLADGLPRFFGALFQLYARDPALSRLFVQDLLFRGDHRPELVALTGELQERIVEIVQNAQDQNDLRSDISAETLTLSFVSHYVFWLQMWLGSGRVEYSAAFAGLRSAIEIQIKGAQSRTGDV